MINLTCQKTHILAWINSDNTLSLKLNGVKYLAYPKLDKRGNNYWKVDNFNPAQSNLDKEKLKEEIEALFKKPMSEQTIEDRKKWAEWTKIQAHEQKIQTSASSSQIKSLLENLKEKKAQEALNSQVEINEPVNP